MSSAGAVLLVLFFFSKAMLCFELCQLFFIYLERVSLLVLVLCVEASCRPHA